MAKVPISQRRKMQKISLSGDLYSVPFVVVRSLERIPQVGMVESLATTNAITESAKN